VAAAANSSASLSFVDNIFNGGGNPPPAVPEPMALALVPLSLAAMALRRKVTRA
jgi:hypothetical protein